MKKTGLWIAGGVVLLVFYGGDYLCLRYRTLKGPDPFEKVTIQPYYAIHEKSGKTEYDFAQPETEICVQSLFPHLGDRPCWYVKRHAEKRIDI